LVESGIIKYKLREELPDTEICPLNLGNKERQLRNQDLMMTYEIVGGGFIISAVIFVIELAVKRSHKPKQAKTNGKSNLLLNQKHTIHVNINNNYEKFGQPPHNAKFITPPPSYHTLFNPPNNENLKKKNINGREYWVYDSLGGGTKMIPMRTPSALLFQYTH
jgi:ionotropic glutamate receptor